MKKYTGNSKPYIYAIFADSDTDYVMQILEKISDKGYALTFHDKWATSAISRTSLVMFFASASVVGDEMVTQELCLANNAGKRIITISLDDTALPPELEFLLGQTQGVYIPAGKEELVEKLLSSPALSELSVSPEQKRAFKRSVIFAISIFAVIALAAAVVFLCGVISYDRAGGTLRELGVSGNFSSIKELYLYGDELKDDYIAPRFAHTGSEDAQIVLYGDEQCNYGDLSDISDFALLKNVRELCLCGNSIQDLTPVSGLKKLRFLDISGNSGVSLKGISSIQSLEELNLYQTDITDYSELLELKNLKIVSVSADAFALVESLPGRSFEVISPDTPVSTFEELKSALENPDVFDITIMESITVPAGESITIGESKRVSGHSAEDGEELIFTNNGTITLSGFWEMGLCTRVNNGTIIITSGGVYNGGMCDTKNEGRFIIEDGGVLRLNRAHNLYVYGGEFVNKGNIYFKECGLLELSSCRFYNSGNIYFDHLVYGGITFNGTHTENSGHAFVSLSEDDSPVQYTEVDFRDIQKYNGLDVH